MSQFSKRILFEVIALTAVIIAVAGADNSRAGIGSGPWTHVVYDTRGNVLAAGGRTANHVPILLTVATRQENERVVATTTFIRGDETLRMERVYDPERGLEVTYSTEIESAKLLVNRDPATSETSAVAVLSDGEIRSVTVNERGDVVAGDGRGVRRAFLEKSHMLPLVREYEKAAASLGGPVPEAGSIMMWKIPDGPCLDSCAKECKGQCTWECVASGISCGICKTSCAAGCFIGCAA